MAGFQDLIYTLDAWGVGDVILPFVLIFTIVFAVLEKTKILGKDDQKAKKYAMVVAMVMAFSVVIAHVMGYNYRGFDVVDIINRALPQVSLLLVAIVMMMLTLGLWTNKRPDGSKGIGVWFTLASGAIVLGIFLASLGVWSVPNWIYSILHSSIMPLVIAILVFGLIVKFIAGDGKSTETAAERLERVKDNRRARQEMLSSFLTGDDGNKSAGDDD